MDRTLSLLVKFAALDKLSAPLKKIGLGSRGASRDLAATTRELADLHRQQGRIDGLKALRGGLTSSHAALDQARRRVRELRLEIASVEKPTARMSAALAAAERKEAKLADTADRHAQKIEHLSRELSDAGVDVARLAGHEEKLASAIGRTNTKLEEQKRKLDQANARQARVERAREIGGRLQSTGMSAAAGSAAIGAPMIASADTWRQFQSGMTDIAQKAETTRDKLGGIGDEVLRMGPAVGQMPIDLQQGLDTLAGLGMKVPQAVAALKPIGKTATAYRADIDDLSNSVFAVTSNLKLFAGAEKDAQEQTRRTGKALDVMATAGKAGGFELKNMARHFPSLTARAQALGQNGLGAVADLSAALQIARRGAGDADEAANNITNLLAKINAKETIENFDKMGVDLPAAMKRAYAQGKTPLEAIAELTERTLGGKLDRLPFLFGDMQAQSGVTALIQNMKDYQAIRAKAGGAGNVVDADFAQRITESAARARQFDASMQALGVRIGSVVGPKIDRLKGGIAGLATSFLAWSDANPRASATLVTLLAGLAAVLAIVGPLAIAIGWMAPGLAIMANGFLRIWTVLRVIGTGLLWLSRLLMANPFMLLVGGLILAAYLIYTHWNRVKAFFAGAWAEIRTAFAGGIGGITALLLRWSPLGVFVRAFVAVFRWFGVDLPAKFRGFGTMLVQGLIAGIKAAFPLASAAIGGLARLASRAFTRPTEIRSPSRLFARFGGYLTRGLAIGVDRGAADPIGRVHDLAGRIAGAAGTGTVAERLRTASRTVAGALATGAAAPALAAAAPAAPSVGAAAAPAVHYHSYDIRIDGARGDVKTMARDLLKEIRKLQAEERRSSYLDGDD